jgi:hypothetical protein
MHQEHCTRAELHTHAEQFARRVLRPETLSDHVGLQTVDETLDGVGQVTEDSHLLLEGRKMFARILPGLLENHDYEQPINVVAALVLRYPPHANGEQHDYVHWQDHDAGILQPVTHDASAPHGPSLVAPPDP